jgi:alanine-glyoxylate transaminase/serine-glyoxylate transaminase/serine-pyruvate transaminase
MSLPTIDDRGPDVTVGGSQKGLMLPPGMLSLGTGLGKLKGRMFRIGNLGDSNDLTLLATLAGCEMGLKLAGVKPAGSGVHTAMDYFAAHPAISTLEKAA